MKTFFYLLNGVFKIKFMKIEKYFFYLKENYKNLYFTV
jgi:hypothetical protein